MLRFTFITMPTWLPPASQPHAASSIGSSACGPSGHGIGFGIYPWHEGIWEGGHVVVSLDPREKNTAAVVEEAIWKASWGTAPCAFVFSIWSRKRFSKTRKRGDQRCVDFVKLWHAALAAGTASSIHLAGPGKFFISGFNARALDINLLNQYVSEMVKNEPAAGYVFEIVPAGSEMP